MKNVMLFQALIIASLLLLWTSFALAEEDNPNKTTEPTEEKTEESDTKAPVVDSDKEKAVEPDKDGDKEKEKAVEPDKDVSTEKEKEKEDNRPEIRPKKIKKNSNADLKKEAIKEVAQSNQPTPDTFKPTRTVDENKLKSLTTTTSYPYIEHHGYMRFRPDLFINMDLGTKGTSPIPPPGEADQDNIDEGVGDSEASVLAGANMRFRYEPTIHIFEDLRIHVTMDILDNMLLGSSPDGLLGSKRFDVPLGTFTGGQAPETPKDSLRDSVRIKRLYGVINTFFGTIMAGRIGSNWGLGILANSGGGWDPLSQEHKCLDCDFGDSVDRVVFITRVFGIYVGFLLDFPDEGTTSEQSNQPFGQPYDMDQSDDVDEYVLTIFQRPLSNEEKELRQKKLKEDRKPVFDWGLYAVYRKQENTSESMPRSYDNTAVSLELRDAWALIPDVWVRLLWEPKPKVKFRLELEAAMIVGNIKQVKNNPDAEPGTLERDLMQFGVALEADLRIEQMLFSIYGGFASGKNSKGFGILDYNNVDNFEKDGRDVTNFKFDRNYQIGMIMFREIMGAITNAIYINPRFEYDFPTKNEDTFGFRVEAILGIAANKEATPSGEGLLGFEGNVSIFWKEKGKFLADLSYGIFIPGTAFDAVAGEPTANQVYWGAQILSNKEAELAHTIQARLIWMF